MRRYGVLVISHGSRDPQWVNLVEEAVRGMDVPADVPGECAFLELVEGRLIQDGLDRLERRGVTDIAVIPLFASSGSVHVDEIAHALGVKPEPEGSGKLPRFRVRARVHLCGPLDDAPEAAEMLYESAMRLSSVPDKEMVWIVAHGSREKGFCGRWQRTLRRLADRVKTAGGFAAADYATLAPDQAACKMQAWRRRRPDLDMIVVPFFLSEGYFTRQAIPRKLQGFSYRYDGRALLPNPLVGRWLTRQASSFLKPDASETAEKEHGNGDQKRGS